MVARADVTQNLLPLPLHHLLHQRRGQVGGLPLVGHLDDGELVIAGQTLLILPRGRGQGLTHAAHGHDGYRHAPGSSRAGTPPRSSNTTSQ